ncbi:MAG: TolC family protein [Sphingomonadales bacterium]|nr:TolC family protein [Sphingomonadales bacterium]
MKWTWKGTRRGGIALALATLGGAQAEAALTPMTPGTGRPAAAAPAASPDPAPPAIPDTPPQSTAAAVTPAVFAGAPGQALPQAAPPVRTLAEAIALAYRANPRLAAQRATLRGTDLKVPAARSAYGPQLDVTASYGFTEDWTDQQDGTRSASSGWTSSVSAALTQPLATFGRNRAGEATARAQVDYARNQLRLVEAQVLLAVVSDYVGVIRDANAVTIARQNVAILERQWQDDSARYRVREITRTDLDQVANRLATARGALILAQGQLAATQAQFLRSVGAPPGELAPPDVLVPPADSLAAALAIADAENPLVRAAQSREKVSRGELESAKAEWLPRVDLRGTAAVGPLSATDNQYRVRRLQAQVVATVPLLDSGKRRALAGEAREANQADWLLIDQALRDERASVAGAWDQMSAARASLDQFGRAVAAARQAYEGGRTEERAGARTTLEVLDLARDLLTVRNSYNAALANEYLARANLMAVMGRLEATKLPVDVAPHDPRQHYWRKAWTADWLLLTPVLRTLDGIVIGRVHGDRPMRDAGLLSQPTAPAIDAPGTETLPEIPGTDR